ncbi:ankyrin repeat domain-containing protein 37 isoform 4-T4 [Glossophaga mutica]
MACALLPGSLQRVPQRSARSRTPVLCFRREMLLLDGNLEVDSLKHLLEAGASVNAPPDPCEQSPVHLAAGGGRAYFLLWQLQTGADLNQQDAFGEAPIHKAARVGSLECLSLLVASDAQIEQKNQVNHPAAIIVFQRSDRSGVLEMQKIQVGKGSVVSSPDEQYL